MSSVASRQKVRLFLEGREVPFQSAVVMSQVGAPTSATISLVPLKEIKFIKPRTQVHIFMQDTKNFPDDDFYLVFEGEVLGREMAKKQDGRAFSVVAIDYSSYWDETKAYVMSPNFTLGKIADVMSLKDGPIDQQIKALGGQVFNTASNSSVPIVDIMLAEGNKDLAKGVVRVIDQLKGANQFYAAAYERLKINDRLRLYSSGKLQEFLQDMKIDEFLKDFTGKFGGIADLRSMLYSVMALVFHDFISFPFPAKTSTGLSNFLFVPDAYTLPAPMCNVVFPNQQQGYSFKEDFRALPTRYSFRASMPLMTGQGIDYPQYPTQFYPTAFSDYMFGKRTATAAELASDLGPSSLLTDSKGRTYKSIFYDKDKSEAIGTSIGLKLREADYLSNEESLKGIYLEMDTFMPGYTALTKTATPEARTKFIQGVGAYLFYKKRFSARQVTAELLFHPFLVPGFNALFLDDSESGQSFVAKLQSVAHTLSNEGCATNVSLAYGRDFDEVDSLTGGTGEPPTPPWFDESVFGSVSKELFKAESEFLLKIRAIDATTKAARDKIEKPTTFKDLNKFYQYTIGTNSTTNYTAKQPIVSTRGAAEYLLFQYRSVSNDPDARDKKVQSLVSRPLMRILDAFFLIGAVPVGYKNTGRFLLPTEYASFTSIKSGTLPGRFDGVGPNVSYPDQKAIALRRSIISDYIKALKAKVGFRG